jgi:ribosomal protein S18 acetylase RimI-like enzyme
MGDLTIHSYLFRGDEDLEPMRLLIEGLPRATTVVDFEETMMLQSVRARTRLWEQNGRLVAFAFVDDFNNLRFEVAERAIVDGRLSDQLQREIVDWGLQLLREANQRRGETNTLDTAFSATNQWQIAMIERQGFIRQKFRTLRYSRSLTGPIPPVPMPAGFSWRAVLGEGEVEALVALHRAAFGTDNMTVEGRLAIMKGAGYERPLDLLALGPQGQLAAFCICEVAPDDPTLGYIDPIGTHPDFQRLGLARALVSTGMALLKEKGVKTAEFGTGRQNEAMQKLGEKSGFTCVAEKYWFSKSAD